MAVMLLESDDDSESINFSESSDSDVNYALEKRWNETDEVVEEVKDDNVIAYGSDVQWVWGALQTLYRGQKFHLLDSVGLRKMLSVLEAFLLFFDQHVTDHIVAGTNR